MAQRPIPGIKQIREAIVDNAENGPNDREAYHAGQPCVTRCARPDSDRAVDADMEASCAVSRVQASANGLQAGRIGSEGVRFQIDVAELYGAVAGRPDEPVALPADPGVANGAFGVVPDSEFG